MTRRNLDLTGALAEARERYAAANPESARRHAEACTALPGGNTRSVLHYDPFPLAVMRGDGATVWDADGHAYTDFIGEYTAGLYGHSHPRIRAAIGEVLAEGHVLCAPNVHEAKLARILCDRFASCERVRFTNSGTEANLMAITAARAHTGRDALLVFDGGYHGGVLYFASGASPVNVPYPTVIGRYNDASGARELIAANAARLAAVLVEPVMGTSGFIPAEPEFLRALSEATQAHGVVLIFDEVMTSRLAPGGAQERYGVTPDMTTFGKYIGGGLTFGAFGGRATIMDRFDPRRPDALPHAGTFNNNVLTMAAGVAGMGEIYTPAAADDLNARGDRLRGALQRAAGELDFPARITGMGSLLGIHFVARPVAGPDDARATPPEARALFHLEMLGRGFYTGKLGLVALSLPLTDDDCSRFVGAFSGFANEHRDIYRRALA
ncbi:MAG: aminotransferase class III-fold pyridoxal phosphate-dependent enzyme [Gammaproteobacteria bacterium]|nr:aminotransferase class III-fold pyridoxal phosphate-dependent enzyme [Gammaproteobacteria bacterium]